MEKYINGCIVYNILDKYNVNLNNIYVSIPN
jgi:hypothetical protein